MALSIRNLFILPLRITTTQLLLLTCFKKRNQTGLETRYAARKYSGFEFKLETIRDRSWVLQGSALDIIRDYHINEDNYAGGTLNYCEAT